MSLTNDQIIEALRRWLLLLLLKILLLLLALLRWLCSPNAAPSSNTGPAAVSLDNAE